MPPIKLKPFDWCLVAASAAAISLFGSVAWSQTSPPPSVSPPVPPTPAPTQAVDAPPVEHLFGDWGGLLTSLSARGVNLQVNAITEFAGNTSGGTRRGATFANQIGIDLDINWERFAGITGFSTHGIVVNRSGASDSVLFGDRLLPVQEVYGAGGDVGVHLASFYGEETLFNGLVDIAAGRMNVESEFANSFICGYKSSDLCADPRALPNGDIGHSAFPDAVWAVRLKLKPSAQTVFKIGAYEVNQGLYSNKYFRTGFEFDTSQDSGVYVPVEGSWEPAFGSDHLTGHYKLGFGYDSSSGYSDFGNGLAAAGVAGFKSKVRSGALQTWILVDQMLIRNGKGDVNGLIVLGGFIHNESDKTAYARQYYAGFIDAGFWPARPKDSISVVMTYVEVSSQLRRVQDVETDLGLPISNYATGPQSNEALIEINYKAHILPGVRLQPDFVYIVRPNGQANLHDAVVLGFRATAEF
jgi:porin